MSNVDIVRSFYHVVSLGHYAGVAKQTGKPLRAAFAHVYKLVDGKVVEFRQYADSVRFLEPLSGS